MKRQTKARLSEGPQKASSEGAEVVLSEGVQVILEHSNKEFGRIEIAKIGKYV